MNKKQVIEAIREERKERIERARDMGAKIIHILIIVMCILAFCTLIYFIGASNGYNDAFEDIIKNINEKPCGSRFKIMTNENIASQYISTDTCNYYKIYDTSMFPIWGKFQNETSEVEDGGF